MYDRDPPGQRMTGWQDAGTGVGVMQSPSGVALNRGVHEPAAPVQAPSGSRRDGSTGMSVGQLLEGSFGELHGTRLLWAALEERVSTYNWLSS